MNVISLKHNIKAVLVSSLSAFLLIQIVVIAFLFQYNHKLNMSYIKNNSVKISQNIDNYLDQLEKNGFSISSNWSFISLYSNQSKENDSYQSAYQIASNICVLNPSILDLIVVDLNGAKRSFFSGYNFAIVDALYSQNTLNNGSNLDRAFYFFPSDDEHYKDYFLYYFPIFGVDNSPILGQKVATAVFVCTRKEFNSCLDFDDDANTSIFRLYFKKQLLSSSGGESDVLSPQEFHSDPYKAVLSHTLFTITGNADSTFQLQNTLVIVIVYLVIIAITFIIVLFAMNRWIFKSITLPIQSVTDQLKNYNSADLNLRIQPTNVAEINEIVDHTNDMIGEIKTITKKIFTAQDRLYETELRKTEAELYALQSQINPHFLYNTMQCIRGLATLNKTEEIKDISLAMTDVFKYSISPGTYVKYLDEIRIIYEYLSIYKIRFHGKIEYDLDVEDAILDYYTVRMIIQPTVENAVTHAFHDPVGIPKIHIIGRIEDQNIIFQIIDNGSGIPTEDLKEIRNKLNTSFETSIKEKSAYGLGLYNINRRIKLAYGMQYGIEIFSNMNGTEVDIITPIQTEPPDMPQTL